MDWLFTISTLSPVLNNVLVPQLILTLDCQPSSWKECRNLEKDVKFNMTLDSLSSATWAWIFSHSMLISTLLLLFFWAWLTPKKEIGHILLSMVYT